MIRGFTGFVHFVVAYADDLLDYEDEEQTEQTITEEKEKDANKKGVKGTYVSIHSSGFRDFLLKPEILRAIYNMNAFLKLS
nr:unnamed protein product [Callosobruchus analis]